MFKFIIATLILTLTSPLQASLVPEFEAIPKKQVLGLSHLKSQIIFETEDSYLLKSSLTNFVSYDYYFVQLPQESASHQWFYDNAQVVFDRPGEFIVARIDNSKQLHELASKVHHEGHACGMIQKLSDTPIVRNKATAPRLVRNAQPEVKQAVGQVNLNELMSQVVTMVSWKTRHHEHTEGVGTGAKIKALYEAYLPSDRHDVEIQLVDHQDTRQQSVLVRIKGQSTPEQIVVIGSHIDSINPRDNDDAPGADDDASGTATNLEAFRVLMEEGYKPQKTIEIHGYAAEEIGLVGSGQMARQYKNENKQVIAMVQMDMNGYTESNPKVTFVSNSTDPSLTQQLRQLVDFYLEIPSTTGFLLFGSSDHASWNRQGFPVAFPTEDPFNFNGEIHTNRDTIGQMNSPEQTFEFAKLAVAYLMHFAG